MSKGLQPTIVLTRDEDGWWTARDEIRGLTAQGETRDGALANLDDVIDAVENEAGRPPTDDELRAAGIDPEANRGSGSGELPDVLEQRRDRMVTRDFSGFEGAKVLVNAGNFSWVRTTGDHAILTWEHPEGPDIEARTVSVPLHDRVRIGTLRAIAEDAGANDFDEFCKWIARNR